MTDLSPAAQAVLDAFSERHELYPFHDNWQEVCIAAALRALAARINGADAIRQDVLDIAAELARQQLNHATPPPPASERWATTTVQGLNWPATLGDFTLVGPADNQGAWRWYERQYNGATHRIKVDHQLMPLFPPHLGEP